MTEIRQDPWIIDLATFAADFDKHPDAEELARRAAHVVAQNKSQSDLVQLALSFTNTADFQRELVRSAREVLGRPQFPMVARRRRFVGLYLLAAFGILIVCAPPLWATANLAIAKTAGETVLITLLGVDVAVTNQLALMSVVVLMAALGSFTVLVLTFINRAGHETLERGFLWWYLLRPMASVGLAVLFYMALAAGYFNQQAGEGHGALVVAAAVGGLTGLFTDKVLQSMKALLGQTPFAVATKSADRTEESSAQ